MGFEWRDQLPMYAFQSAARSAKGEDPIRYPATRDALSSIWLWAKGGALVGWDATWSIEDSDNVQA